MKFLLLVCRISCKQNARSDGRTHSRTTAVAGKHNMHFKNIDPYVVLNIILKFQGIARTQSPTTRNYALDLPTFGVIAGVNPTEVQWKGLALGDRPR